MPNQKSRSMRRGAIILDALFAAFVVGMGAVAVFSLYPMITRSEKMAREETLAVQISTRLIEHIQLLPARDIEVGHLKSLNLIEADDDSSPYSFAHIPLDEASRYSPAQVLQDAVAELEITDLDANSKAVSITLRYTSASGRTNTIQTGTIVGGYR